MSGPIGVVASLWRYPVKGMQGEILEWAEVEDDGIVGDRRYVVREFLSEPLVGEKTDALSGGAVLGAEQMIQLKAEYLDDFPNSRLPDMRIAASDGSSLFRWMTASMISSARFFTSTSASCPQTGSWGGRARSGRALHLLTTATMRKIKEYFPEGNFDVRRFRPNIVVDPSEETSGFLEEEWVAETLAVGPQIRIRIERPNSRCAATTLPQDSIPSDDRILETIARENQNNLGVMCSVIRSGIVRMGDILTAV